MIMANQATKRAESSDLLSRLPDELLIHILSFVPTVTSVRTCVLSKRWSRLWISVPNIDFSGFVTKSSVRQAQFENFVDRFLSLTNVTSVRTIQLHVGYETEVSRVNAWIVSLSELDAEEFRLSFLLLPSDEFDFPINSMPDNFFIQNSLVKLELSAVFLDVPQLVCFPNLKTMDLDSIQFFDSSCLKNLLSGSPVLGSLCMNLDQGDETETLYICSSSLRNLCLVMKEGDNDYDREIVMDTPNLRDLSVTENVCSTYIMTNLSSLVRACLRIRNEGMAFFKLVTQISHVKELNLLGLYFTPVFTHTSPVTMPIFNNLVHLNVIVHWKDKWETLFRLLHCTPNLVTFILNKPLFGGFGNCAWCEPHKVPQCFLSSIESVEIKWVEDGDQDMQMMSYILKNAMVLKKLSLCRSPRQAKDLVTENKFLMTLLTLPRSSATAACQVEYRRL